MEMADGTATDNTLRWDGSNWTENPTLTATASGTAVLNAEANSTSQLTIGEDTTLRGSAQDARIEIYAEEAAAIYGAAIAVGGNNLQLLGVGGNPISNVQSSMSIDILAGQQLTVRDSTNADTITFQHSGTDANTTFVGTTDWNVIGLTGDFWVRDGAGLKISDAGDTDFAVFSHNGSNFITSFTSTSNWDVTGLSAALRLYNNSYNMQGFSHRWYGAGGTNAVTMNHNDTDFVVTTSAVQTGDFSLIGFASVTMVLTLTPRSRIRLTGTSPG
jgi:hypothetical protein